MDPATLAALAALITAAAPIVVQLLKLLSAKTENEKTKAVAAAAEQAVLVVEAPAAAYAKTNPELAAKGAQKLDQARAELQKKYPKLPVAEAEALIKAVLPKLGLGAAGKNIMKGVTQ